MSPSSVDPLQLWILTASVVIKWYFPVLTSGDRFARQSNLRIPPVDGSALVDAIERLLASGLLMAELHHRRVPWESRERIESWIAAEPFTPETVHFGLTPEGGTFWERACDADWSRFLYGSGSCHMIDPAGEEFTSWFHYEGATESRVTEFAHLCETVSLHRRLKAKTRDLRPWRATYWKTLPSGFRLSTQYRYVTDPSKQIWMAGRLAEQSVCQALGELRQWYRNPS